MAKIAMMLASNQRRGAELFGTALAGRLVDRGFEVELLALCPATTSPRLDLEPLGSSRRDIRLWRRAVEAARRSDAVFGIGSTTLSVGAVAARLAGRPFVYRSIGDPQYWGAVRLASWRVGAPLRSAAFVGALFPRAQEFLIERYGVDPSKVGVIPSAVDVERFRLAEESERAAARQALGIEGDLAIGVIGALSPEKDPGLALDTAVALASPGNAGDTGNRGDRRDDPRPAAVHLFFVGDGPMIDQLKFRAESASPLKVSFLGVRTDVSELLPAFDCVLMPSLTEGIPRAAIEAGLRGVPVVGTEAGGLGFVVADGVTGYVVNKRDAAALANAVRSAVADRSRLGLAAHERTADLFSLDKVADQWATALTAVVRSGRQ